MGISYAVSPVSEKAFPDGHVAQVWPMTFGKGRIALMPHAGSWDVINAWCYESLVEAVIALNNWDDPDKEPEGWMRNPQTGRRRPGGDASKEYVRP